MWRDLVVALAAFWLIASLAFTVGRWFVPGFAVSSVVDALAGRDASSAELLQARLFELRSTLGATESAAALDATGAVTGGHHFDHVDGFSLLEVEPGSYEIRLRLLGGTTVLLIAAGAVPVGEVQSEGFSVTVSAPGKTFNSEAGECSLEITSIDTVIPRIAGWVECRQLTDSRGGAALSFLAAFDAQPAGF